MPPSWRGDSRRTAARPNPGKPIIAWITHGMTEMVAATTHINPPSTRDTHRDRLIFSPRSYAAIMIFAVLREVRHGRPRKLGASGRGDPHSTGDTNPPTDDAGPDGHVESFRRRASWTANRSPSVLPLRGRPATSSSSAIEPASSSCRSMRSSRCGRHCGVKPQVTGCDPVLAPYRVEQAAEPGLKTRLFLARSRD
jgi:hypothetical protein